MECGGCDRKVDLYLNNRLMKKENKMIETMAWITIIAIVLFILWIRYQLYYVS
jgi:hypothetical protein